MDNARIARAFDELADLLELSGEGALKVRAYRQFAEEAAALEEPLAEMAKKRAVAKTANAGKAIAAKVDDLLRTGTFDALERARAEIPATLRELLHVPGLGAKSATRLWREANVASLVELAYACDEGRVAALTGFGEKKQEKIGIEVRKLVEGTGSMPLAVALEIAARLVHVLAQGGAGVREIVSPPGATVQTSGAARRGVDVVPELLILVRGACATRAHAAITGARVALGATSIAKHGDDVLVHFEGGGRARIMAVPHEEWLLTLIETTGSETHVRWLQGLASKKGGLGRVCSKATTEEDVYTALGVPFAPPELRENAGAAPSSAFPGVWGIFHVHTEWSDGASTIVEMTREAARTGFEYIGISDHSRAASYANGLDGARLREQKSAIARARREVSGIAILHGVEVDILKDGELDLDDDVLGALDFVIASVHTDLVMDPAEMTARVIRAVSHPLVTMLGHPTGRLLLGRRGFTFDVEAVAKAAAANDTYLEINANAQRLDLSDVHVRRAAACGARFVINPDAHVMHGLADTALGVTLARRAGLTREQVLNAREKDDVVKTLAARKSAALKRRRASV